MHSLDTKAASGWHVTNFGSNANNGTNAGRFYWNLNNGSSNRNRNIASQLAVAPVSLAQHKAPAQPGEYVNPIALGSSGEQRGEQQR